MCLFATELSAELGGTKTSIYKWCPAFSNYIHMKPDKALEELLDIKEKSQAWILGGNIFSGGFSLLESSRGMVPLRKAS